MTASSRREALVVEEPTAVDIAKGLTAAEAKVLGKMKAGGWHTAKQLGTTGALMFELWDWRRDIRGIAPPVQLVFRERMEPEGIVMWELSDLGDEVKGAIAATGAA